MYPRKSVKSMRYPSSRGRFQSKGRFARSAAYTRGRNFGGPRASRDELKYLDVLYSNYVADTTGTVTLLNGIASGNSAITREGRQCYWKTVEVNGLIHCLDTTTLDCRTDFYVIYDAQPGAAVPVMTDLLVESNAASFHNLNFRERFKTLIHGKFSLGYSNDGTSGPPPGPQVVCFYKKINLRTTFKGDGNAIGDIATGAIYLVTIGNVAPGNGGQFQVCCRLRFAEK